MVNKTGSVVSVILAAGESRRMGFPKALLTYHGKSFLQHIIDCHLAASLSPYVLLGAHRHEIERVTNLSRVAVLINPDPSRGQLSSIHVALQAVPDSSALIVHPVDHPLVRSQTLRSLVNFHVRIPACIVIPQHLGKKGHPVLFPARFYPDLGAASPSEGARAVVHRNPPCTFLLPVDDPGILQDIDTPEDFQKLY